MFHRDFHNVPLVWEPTENSGKQMKRLKKAFEDKHSVKFDGYEDFQKWSVDHLYEFWEGMWDFLGIICSKRFDKVIDLNASVSELPKWFEGGRLNFAENLLRFRDDRPALITEAEDSEVEVITFNQMYEEAKLYAAAFRKFGLKKGDIVCCYMSNRKEAVFAMQAANSIGAIWSGALPLLGGEAALNRFKQVKPRVLLTVDRFLNDGIEIDMLAKVKEIADGIPSLEKILIAVSKKDSPMKDISGIKNGCFLHDFLKEGLDKDGSVPPIQFEQVSFSHPVIISYTSGTTGLPKPVIHGCGVLMSITNAFGVNYDYDRNDRWLSVSPVGWASWTIFTTLHFLGITVVFYEGSPFYRTPTQFWDIIDKHKISHFFLAGSVYDELQKRKYLPTEKHDLSSLKLMLAGGCVVKPQTFDFMSKILKGKMFTTSYGCTEVMGIALVTELTLPQYKVEINAICLGTAVELVDENGKPVRDGFGEIVLSKPMPGLLLGLWGDKDGSASYEKYFSKYPGKFAMGDYGIFNPVTKSWIICCRSDETLKQRGCRFGSAEIYNVVETFPEIRDSLCVSQYNKSMDERAVLFLKIRDGFKYSEELVSRIRKAIEEKLTVRHVPDVIIETPDIPYNMNGKKTEIIVKKILNNLPCSQDSIVNSECLEFYKTVPALQGF